jgi:hypothetical protein
MPHHPPAGYRPSPRDRKRLSVESLGVAEKTILRAYARPATVRESTRLRIAAAAVKLGLPTPPGTTASAED